MKKVLLSLIILFSFVSATPEVAKLEQSLPQRLNQSSFISEAQLDAPLHILVWLKGQNQTQFQTLLKNLYTPGNPEYHKFISAKQYNTNYAPSDATVNSVKQYLLDRGLNIDYIPPNNAFISVKTTVAGAEQAFAVKINNYNYNGRKVYSNDSMVTLETKIASEITGISGLDNFAQIHQHIAKAVPSGDLQAGQYTPQNIQRAYGGDRLIKDGITGTGQTIALMDVCNQPTAEADLLTYSTRYS